MSHAANSYLLRIFEAPLQKLYEIRASSPPDEVCGFYSKVLVEYLAGSNDLLCETVEGFMSNYAAQTPDGHAALALARCRRQIRRKGTDPDSMESVLEPMVLLTQRPSVWQGEAYFVLGRLHDVLGQNAEAMAAYHSAAEVLKAQGCLKKAAKCRINAVGIRSRIEPELNYIREWFDCLKMARMAREYGMAGVSLLNISREMQKAGALGTALRAARLALKFMKDEYGSLNYYLVLVHRCSVLLELGRKQEAREDYERARLSKHLEIRAATGALARRLEEGKTVAFLSPHLTPAWKERLNEGACDAPQLSQMEEILVKLLVTGPKSRAELIQTLWGKSLGAEVLEARFKMLLLRIRRKIPGLVVFDHGAYRLMDQTARTSRRDKKRKAG